jgi:hypothetical protein
MNALEAPYAGAARPTRSPASDEIQTMWPEPRSSKHAAASMAAFTQPVTLTPIVASTRPGLRKPMPALTTNRSTRQSRSNNAVVVELRAPALNHSSVDFLSNAADSSRSKGSRRDPEWGIAHRYMAAPPLLRDAALSVTPVLCLLFHLFCFPFEIRAFYEAYPLLLLLSLPALGQRLGIDYRPAQTEPAAA